MGVKNSETEIWTRDTHCAYIDGRRICISAPGKPFAGCQRYYARDHKFERLCVEDVYRRCLMYKRSRFCYTLLRTVERSKVVYKKACGAHRGPPNSRISSF